MNKIELQWDQYKLLELLEEWDQSKQDIKSYLWCLWRVEDIVYSINRRFTRQWFTKPIEWKTISWVYKYKLVSNLSDYDILIKDIKLKLDEVKQMMCNTCNYKVKNEQYFRNIAMFWAIFLWLGLVIGFLLAYNIVETIIEITPEALWVLKSL